jgi:uncharacterized protein YutE (UPF0331/DUF86 family)
MDRVLFSKFRSIERCLARVREEYVGHEAEFETDLTRQDATMMNLVRACEQAIDMANRVIRLRQLEPADDARAAFATLRRAGLLEPELEAMMRRMVGFRNVAVHSYEELDLSKIRVVIETRIDDLVTFARAMMQADPSRGAADGL